MPIKILPKTIYAYIENEGDKPNECILAYDNATEAASFDEKKTVGVYELKETVTVEAVAKITPAR
jgi:hypothetical protein